MRTLKPKIVFEEIDNFVQEYNQPATKEVLCIEVEKRQDINDTTFSEITKLISYLEDVPTDYDWLCDTTEKWCRDRAIYLALMESIALADGKDKEKDRGAIPVFCQMLWQFLLTHTSVMITYLIMKRDMNLTTAKKIRSNSTLSISTRLRKVVYRIKLLILLLLALVSVKVCLCAMLPLPHSWEGRTYYTSRLKWLRKKLQSELMLIFSMYLFRR